MGRAHARGGLGSEARRSTAPAVTAPHDYTYGCDSGKVFVFYGPLTDISMAGDADAQLYGTVLADGAGSSVSSAGDVDGDGNDDVLIGGGGVGCTAYTGIGYAYLMHGPLYGSYDLSQADAVMEGDEVEDDTGEAVALGDFDRDGHAEVVVGAPGHTIDGVRMGQVYVLRDPVEGFIALADAATVIHGEFPGGGAGGALAVGDVNGGGYPDLVVGAGDPRQSQNDPGRFYLELDGPLRASP